MIPAGVTRIIGALAPNDVVRDAMLGDFAEECQQIELRQSRAAARRWAWKEATRSLLGALRHSFPALGTIATNVVPAMLWGYLIGLLTMLAGVMVSMPLVCLLAQAMDGKTALLLTIVLLTTPVGVIAGFETAEVGKRAPLWSAVLLGLGLAALTLGGLLIDLPGTRIPLPWYRTAVVVQQLQLLPALVAGAILQQSMSHRFARRNDAKGG